MKTLLKLTFDIAAITLLPGLISGWTFTAPAVVIACPRC